MASYKIQWDSRALKELDTLGKENIKRILTKVSELSLNSKLGKQLKGPFSGYYRIRVGVYRIIYSIEKKILQVHILRVGHRSKVYK
ncbi:MAG: type II toxin-antitoxin system RelE/ParE family toxin [Candidatus Marinimicrobia bacterium]|nr:type II toxin-antitoxin system RelE/ParE family toxin [Candidatus Neomarinimicrobiota bacterium]